MKRKARFFTGLAAAALTFGSLMATLGPQRFNAHRHGCYQSHCQAPPPATQSNTVAGQ
ncbi:MAG: hypothetical protein IT236_09890 [Bacteroidia bacterium]|nr:hypothetical protein [Bacteroidia bacterium]